MENVLLAQAVIGGMLYLDVVINIVTWMVVDHRVPQRIQSVLEYHHFLKELDNVFKER
jgi:hypothetical protein